ncbi:hypothetical protein DL770_006850 [Monosporascus sp. CRB-9-2]|nr:hypothetical protein DL770_006850 [Monosporascus sp. CRB-9-2]
MEVSHSQLYGLLPCMLDLIESSRFVAIDLEMTGISFGDVGASSSLVRLQEAYSQAKKAAETFGIVQIGPTFIHYDEASSEYSAKAFNIRVSSELAVKDVQPNTVHSLTKLLDPVPSVSIHEERLAKQWVQAKEHGSRADRVREVEYLAGLRYVFEALAGGCFASKIRREWTWESSVPEGHSNLKDFNKDFDAVNGLTLAIGYSKASIGRASSRYTPPSPVLATRGYEGLRGRESTAGPATEQQVKRGHAHMAGYDSEMTGKLFLKLACRLFSGNEHTKLNSENIYSPSSSSSAAENGTAGAGAGSRGAKKPLNSLLDDDDISPTELRDLQLKHPGLVAAPSTKLELESMAGETYSPREVHILPLWTNHFWSIYGNKMWLPMNNTELRWTIEIGNMGENFIEFERVVSSDDVDDN